MMTSREERLNQLRRRRMIRQKIARAVIHIFVGMGIAVAYYIAFSIFFDTPTEYAAKHSMDKLRDEYEILTARYDSINRVIDNVVARDRNVFNILFEAEPYDMSDESGRWSEYEHLLGLPTDRLTKTFSDGLQSMQQKITDLAASGTPEIDQWPVLMEASDEGELVRMYTSADKKDGDFINGFLLLASEPEECTFIYIDGSMSRADFEALMAASMR